MNPDDRYLNVQYGSLTAEVNITGISRLGGVKSAIKREFGEAIPVAPALIQLYTTNRDQLITDLDDITPELTPQYYQELTKGGSCVVIGIAAPPTRESSKNGRFEACSDYFITAGNERKRRSAEWKVSKIAQLSYDPNSTLFELDTNYLAGTSLPAQKLILYCRPTFHEQFNFLRKRVIDQSVLGWILGPPATGKSTTALAFASTLDRNEWVVTWIHLDREEAPVCVRLEGDSKKSRIIYVHELDEILEEVDSSKKHIVFLDGYVLNGPKHIDALQACYFWLRKQREKRRLVIVCSMSARYKVKPEKDMQRNLEELFVQSWTEQEFLDAMKNQDFLNNVQKQKVLDSDLSIDGSATAEDLVHSKYYFAGASVRWMFLFSTKTIIEQTDISVASVDDIIPYIKGALGDLSNHVVNRLFSSSIVRDDMFPRKTSIISRFAAVKSAIKAGPDLIRRLADATRIEANPSMDGWMLEMWFFASLCHGGVKLFDSNGEECLTWPKSDVKTLDMNSFPAIPENNGVWFKPSKWNKGGFDAIFLEKRTGLVKFVQITGCETHSFKIEYFYRFLLALVQCLQSFEITSVEIVVVVDQKEHSTFKLAKPSVPGMLKDYGWKSGEELDKVKVVFIKGWRD